MYAGLGAIKIHKSLFWIVQFAFELWVQFGSTRINFKARLDLEIKSN